MSGAVGIEPTGGPVFSGSYRERLGLQSYEKKGHEICGSWEVKVKVISNDY
jgi:hypothetical protein